jgi:hypothetical protein
VFVELQLHGAAVSVTFQKMVVTALKSKQCCVCLEMGAGNHNCDQCEESVHSISCSVRSGEDNTATYICHTCQSPVVVAGGAAVPRDASAEKEANEAGHDKSGGAPVAPPKSGEGEAAAALSEGGAAAGGAPASPPKSGEGEAAADLSEGGAAAGGAPAAPPKHGDVEAAAPLSEGGTTAGGGSPLDAPVEKEANEATQW